MERFSGGPHRGHHRGGRGVRDRPKGVSSPVVSRKKVQLAEWKSGSAIESK